MKTQKQMRGKKRSFGDNCYHHIYQRTIHGELLFYSVFDRLVFYTLYATLEKHYKIVSLAVALMFDHFHTLIKAMDRPTLSRFLGTLTSQYALAFNRDSGRHGPMFQKVFGSAIKIGEKKTRTCIAYIYNNSVEKRIYTRAESDPWNFLAYLNSSHPFSEPVSEKDASERLLLSMSIVKSSAKRNASLSYDQLRSLFDTLSDKEAGQLLDHIISCYLPIDKDNMINHFKSYEDMVLAINSFTGSEYDIREDDDPASHTVYIKMLDITAHSSYLGNPKVLTALPEDRKRHIANILQQKTGAKWYQIQKFLHLFKNEAADFQQLTDQRCNLLCTANP